MADGKDLLSTEPTPQEDKTLKPLTYSEKQWLNVKKKSPKNRIRARNEQLRKMLSPKNALMALNELLKETGNDVACFQVVPDMEPNQPPMYCATLTTRSLDFAVKGYADSKSKAKKNAAERALKAIYIDRLKKYSKVELEWQAKREKRQKEMEERQKEKDQKQIDGPFEDDAEAEEGAGEMEQGTLEPQDEEETKETVILPMVQLTSFALYKLFTSWENEGFVVPNFSSAENKTTNSQGNKKVKAKVKKPAKRRRLPLNASALHPGFLLYYMHPWIEYKDVAIEGQKGQDIYVVSVETEGKSYLGRASSKKEARRLAAKAACVELFQVTFEQSSNSNQPVWADEEDEDTNPAKKPKIPEPME